MSNWTEKTVWTCEINNATLEVTHHLPMATELDKWTITVFIYPDHHKFDDIYNNVNIIPTVKYPLLITNYNRHDFVTIFVTSIQVSDTQVFERAYGVIQQNRKVFKDAATIIKWLNATE